MAIATMDIPIVNHKPYLARYFEREKQDTRQLLRSRGSMAFNSHKSAEHSYI
jgi:hypothetical protein